MIITKYDRNMSNLFFENQPNEICSHLSETVSRGRFLKSEMLQNYRNDRRKRKGEKETARRRKGGEEKQSNGCARSFIIATLESFWRRKLNCWAQKVHSSITFLKILFTLSRS